MALKPPIFSLTMFVWGMALLGSETASANPLIFNAAAFAAQKCPPDADELFPDPEYCTKFYQCVHGVPVSRDCPKGLVFRDTLNICVYAGSEFDTCTPAHPDRECKRGTLELIPHPIRCQGYYNCSDYVPYDVMDYPWSRGYEKECQFPQLFDIVVKKCVGYKHVTCGDGRQEAKWKCDYYANQCPVAMCRPCWVDNPSCVGKPDGVWPVKYALWSPYYIECTDERDFKGRLQCRDDKVFDPDRRECVHGRDMNFKMAASGQ